MSGGLVVLGDMMSQPTRAVVWLLKLTNQEFQFKRVNLAKGEHRGGAFRETISKLPQIPAIIVHDGFTLVESHAIMKYLIKELNLPQRYYPSDPKKRAMIDEYLCWHHGNLRHGAAGTAFAKVIGPRFRGITIPDEVQNHTAKVLKKSLRMMETVFLQPGPFMCGSSEVTIADISACCELMQLELVNLDLSPYPGIQSRMQRMQGVHHFAEVHKFVYKVKQLISSSRL